MQNTWMFSHCTRRHYSLWWFNSPGQVCKITNIMHIIIGNKSRCYLKSHISMSLFHVRFFLFLSFFSFAWIPSLFIRSSHSLLCVIWLIYVGRTRKYIIDNEMLWFNWNAEKKNTKIARYQWTDVKPSLTIYTINKQISIFNDLNSTKKKTNDNNNKCTKALR